MLGWIQDNLFVIVIAFVFISIVQTVVQRYRAKRARGAQGKQIVASTSVRRRTDGSLAYARIEYANGASYEGEFSQKGEFHGLGCYAYAPVFVPTPTGLIRGTWSLITRTLGRSDKSPVLTYDRMVLNNVFKEHRASQNQGPFRHVSRHAVWRAHGLERCLSNTDFVGYVGEFRHGVQHGFGREFTLGGQAYEGTFVDGVRKGHGVQAYEGGEKGVYVGLFDNDKKDDPKGTFRFGPNVDEEVDPDLTLNNAVYVGAFVNGLRHGQGILTRENGTTNAQEWDSGTCVKI